MDRAISEPKRDTLAGVPETALGPMSSRIMDKRLAGVRVIGFSLAGEESFVAAPEYSVCFDIGRAPREVIPIDNVCLSHGHMDHAAGIAYYLSQRRFQGNSPGRIIVHRGIAQAIQRLMDCWADIERHHSPGQILGVMPLEDVTLRRGLIVRPFEVPHTATSLGFSLIEVRHRLRAELQGKSGPELVALKRQGVAIDEYFEMSLLTFTGDTTVGKFLEHDFVRDTRGLLVECTFFERDHISRALEGRHIHANDFPRVLEAVPNAEVMIIHHSRRTDIRLAKRILQRVIRPSDMDRVSFLMDRPPKGSFSRTQPDAKGADGESP